jgi:hypothetical protein
MNGKKLDFIFGLSSLIGLIITAIVTLFAIIEGEYGTQHSLVILSLAFINLALAIVCIHLLKRSDILSKKNSSLEPTLVGLNNQLSQLKKEYQKNKYNFGEIADITHSIQDQLRDRIYELYEEHSAIVAGENILPMEKIDYGRTNELFYLFLIDNIKRIFDLLTEDKCSVCIKILEENVYELDNSICKNDIMLRTFMRDSGSYIERKSSDNSFQEYPYYENTAFKTILSPDNNESYYVSDSLSEETTYVNINNNWNKYYNATLVCPIRIELLDDEEALNTEYSVLGFICIDNRKGGFANRIAIQTLAGISDSLYNHFLLFNELQNVIYEKKATNVEQVAVEDEK